jgi:hypothetical protein
MLEQSAALAIALTAGNFLYAGFRSKNYGKAFERSYFQVIAIVLLYSTNRFGI